MSIGFFEFDFLNYRESCRLHTGMLKLFNEQIQAIRNFKRRDAPILSVFCPGDRREKYDEENPHENIETTQEGTLTCCLMNN